MYSLSKALGFSLDTPWKELPEPARNAILYGIEPQKIALIVAARREGEARRSGRQGGRLPRHRAAHRAPLPPLPPARRGELPDGGVARQGDGRAHLPRLQRRAPPRDAAAVHDRRQEHPRRRPAQLRRAARRFSAPSSPPAAAPTPAGRCSTRSAAGCELLLGIGLDYLNFNRRSGTLSGGESQRIRLSTQIGSGLMGMLYVLDEPSIGLHPKDNVKMIATLESLRDIGNTVIVVEHDEDTIRAADHVVEMGPGPGRAWRQRRGPGHARRHRSRCKASPTGQFFSGRRSIATPSAAAQGQRQDARRPRRAREQPEVDRRDVPARHRSSRSPARPVRARARWSTRSSTRRSGSGSSTRGRCPATTTASTALEHVHKVVNIDQSPIGRNSRSNPATYIGFYDTIRDLFTHAPLSVGARATSRGASASTSRAAAARSARAKASSRRSSTSCPTSR